MLTYGAAAGRVPLHLHRAAASRSRRVAAQHAHRATAWECRGAASRALLKRGGAPQRRPGVLRGRVQARVGHQALARRACRSQQSS